MARKGNVLLTYVITAPPELVAEGDRIFASHVGWMETSHHREGEKALLVYDVAKAPELSNPFDPSSEPTGNTNFILSEVYASEAGVQDHFEQAMSGWDDFQALVDWISNCKVTGTPAAAIFNSLW